MFKFSMVVLGVFLVWIMLATVENTRLIVNELKEMNEILRNSQS